MILAVVGSRSFQDYDFLAATLDKRLYDTTKPALTTIVSGGADGADKLAARYAKERGLQLIEFLPEYGKYPPKRAPLIRNVQIVACADAVLCFWDGRSTGCMHAVKCATALGVPAHTVLV